MRHNSKASGNEENRPSDKDELGIRNLLPSLGIPELTVSSGVAAVQRYFTTSEVMRAVTGYSEITKPFRHLTEMRDILQSYIPQSFTDDIAAMYAKPSFSIAETLGATAFATLSEPFGGFYAGIKAFEVDHRNSIMETALGLASQAAFRSPIIDLGQKLINDNHFIASLTAFRYPLAEYFEEELETIDESEVYADKALIAPAPIQLLRKGKELIRYIAESPGRIFQMSPRNFEEFVGELFYADGFEVELTPQTRDGGCDLIVSQTDVLGISREYVVECKQYSQENKIGLDIIQRLVGVAVNRDAYAGLVVTTSTFTADARKCALKSKLQIELKDYHSLLEWIKRHGFTFDAAWRGNNN